MTGGILIFGGNRGTGLEAARVLRGRGEAVTVLVRDGSDASALETIGATVLRGDALDPEAVASAFAAGEFRAVVNSLGGKIGEIPRPDVEGTRLVIEAACKAGVRRLVMVTAIGAGDSEAAVAPKVLEVLGEALAGKSRAEEILQSSGLDYTILRPGGMTTDPASGTAILTDDHTRMGVINRADLGALIAQCLDDESCIGRIYHAVDPEITWEPPLQRGEDLPARRP